MDTVSISLAMTAPCPSFIAIQTLMVKRTVNLVTAEANLTEFDTRSDKCYPAFSVSQYRTRMLLCPLTLAPTVTEIVRIS